MTTVDDSVLAGADRKSNRGDKGDKRRKRNRSRSRGKGLAAVAEANKRAQNAADAGATSAASVGASGAAGVDASREEPAVALLTAMMNGLAVGKGTRTTIRTTTLSTEARMGKIRGILHRRGKGEG